MRHYGLRVGQEINYPLGAGKFIKCRVVALHALDNNGCTLEILEGNLKGEREKGVCEWCKKNEQTQTR